MFEVFGRTGPPILGGRQFWHPLFSVTYLFSTSYSALQSPDPRETHKFTQQVWRAKNALKLTYSKLEFKKKFRGQTPRPPLLNPILNTMNRAANCLTPAQCGTVLYAHTVLQSLRSMLMC